VLLQFVQQRLRVLSVFGSHLQLHRTDEGIEAGAEAAPREQVLHALALRKTLNTC